MESNGDDFKVKDEFSKEKCLGKVKRS